MKNVVVNVNLGTVWATTVAARLTGSNASRKKTGLHVRAERIDAKTHREGVNTIDLTFESIFTILWPI